ncbi:MAG: hypothetical protein RSB14_07210, partial [Kiritimatiellia bacterium]
MGESTVTEEIQNATKTFKNKFGDEASLSMMDVNVEMVETTVTNIFEGSFKVHVYWTEYADIDSYLIFDDGTHLYYGNKSSYGCSLDIDDTRGGTGEWLTLNFDTIPSHINQIFVRATGFNSCADTEMSLQKAWSGGVSYPAVVSTFVTDRGKDLGYFSRNGDGWDFYAYDGTVVKGHETVVTGKNLADALTDVSWRDGAER